MSSYPAETEVAATPLRVEPSVTTQASDVRAWFHHWWIPFGASSLFVVSGHLLIKSGLSAVALGATPLPLWTRIFHFITQGEVAAGLLVYFLGSLCWMMAVAQQEISFLYPLSSINYVLVVFASSVFFGETVSLRRMSGVIVIVLGMVLMNRKARGPAQ
jgi:drug/metabolite transporter (DMT)-like permease